MIVKLLPHNSCIQVQHILHCRLEMTSGIIRLANINMVLLPIVPCLESISDRYEAVHNAAQQVEGWLQLCLGAVCLDSSRTDCDVVVLSTHFVVVGREHNVDVLFPGCLLLRYNDLAGLCVVSVRNGVVHNTNGPNDLSSGPDFVHAYIGGVAQHEATAGHVLPRPHPTHGPITVEYEFVHWLVQDVGAPVDGREPGEPLWNASDAVDGIDKRGVAIPADAFYIEFDFHYGLECRLLDEVVIGV